MKRFWGLAGVVLVLATVTALAVGMVVRAQAPTATLQAGRSAGRIPSDRDGPGGELRQGRLSSVELEAIAPLLDMTADELASKLMDGETLADLADAADVDLRALYDAAQAARIAAQKASITSAVEDGKMPQGQADWLLEGLDKGYSLGMGLGKFEFGRTGDSSEREAIAKALNMTTDELKLQLWGGRTYSDLAVEAGVDVADVNSAAQAARQQVISRQVAQAVNDGVITQSHADWLLEGLENGYLGKAPDGLRHGPPDGKPGGPMPSRSSGAPGRGAKPSTDDSARILGPQALIG